MIIAARTQSLKGDYTLDGAVEKIAELGFRGVELCLEDQFFKPLKANISDDMIKRTNEVCDSHDFVEISVGCHSDFVHFDDVFDYLNSAISRAGRFNTSTFVVGAVQRFTIKRESSTWDDETREYRKRSRELCRVAEDSGIRLAFEPEIDCILRTSQDLLDMIDDIDSPSLCVNFDIGHSFLTDADPLNQMRKLGDKIIHTHIENMFRGWHNHQLPLKGNGDMDLPSFFKVLHEIQFKGNLALDLYNHDLADIAEICRKSIAELVEETAIGD